MTCHTEQPLTTEALQEIHVSLNMLASRTIAQSGGVILTVLIIPDPDHEFLTTHFVNTRPGNVHNLKVEKVVHAVEKECTRALNCLYLALAKEAQTQ